METWASTNQKGGVGKSAVSLHVSHALAAAGARVLLVDLDPQGTSTATTDTDPEDSPSVYEVLTAESALLEVIRPARAWGFDVAPAVIAMARLEQISQLGSEFRLAEALGTVADRYDVAVIDMPPSLGRLCLAGLVAATRALIITEPSAPALRGVGDLLDTIDVVARRYAPGLGLAGVVTNRVAPTKEAAARVEELRGVFGERLWEPFVPQRTAVSEAMGAHVPVTALSGDGARAVGDVFAALAEKVRPKERSMENA